MLYICFDHGCRFPKSMLVDRDIRHQYAAHVGLSRFIHCHTSRSHTDGNGGWFQSFPVAPCLAHDSLSI